MLTRELEFLDLELKQHFKTMKRSNYISLKLICFLVFTVTLNSCEDITSEDNTTTASFNTFQELVQGRLPSLYANLRSNALYRQGGLINTWGDVGVDTHSGTLFPAEYVPLYAYTYGEGTELISETWIEFYAAIKQINTFLGQINTISGGKERDKSVAIAEARFLRALLYFDMVKIWRNIPLIVNESLTLNVVRQEAEKPNSTAAEIYVQIEMDLQFAKENLLSKTELGTTDIASAEAAQALLGKVYLQMTTSIEYGGVEGGIDANGNSVSIMRRFEQAKEELEGVINSNVFELEENFADIFAVDNEDSNTEVIFSVGYDGPNNEVGGDFGDFLGLGDNKDGGGFGAYRINLDFAFEYLKNDSIVSKTEVVDPDTNLLPKKLKIFNGNINFSDDAKLLGVENFVSDVRFEHTVARFDALSLARAARGEGNATPLDIFNAKNRNIDAWSPFKYSKPIPNPNDAGDGLIDFPYLRYADVLLMYAEVLNELGDNVNATEYLNMVTKRALKDQVLKDVPQFIDPNEDPPRAVEYVIPTTEEEGTNQGVLRAAVENNSEPVNEEDFLAPEGLSKEELLNLIVRERLLELAYEGKRKDDLIRTGKLDEIIERLHENSVNTSLANQASVKASFELSKHVNWAIPLKEILLNKNLQQNCEYGDAPAGCF